MHTHLTCGGWGHTVHTNRIGCPFAWELPCLSKRLFGQLFALHLLFNRLRAILFIEFCPTFVLLMNTALCFQALLCRSFTLCLSHLLMLDKLFGCRSGLVLFDPIEHRFI